jgi:hypothetical protein
MIDARWFTGSNQLADLATAIGAMRRGESRPTLATADP